jgi:hypothetical protein
MVEESVRISNIDDGFPSTSIVDIVHIYIKYMYFYACIPPTLFATCTFITVSARDASANNAFLCDALDLTQTHMRAESLNHVYRAVVTSVVPSAGAG